MGGLAQAWRNPGPRFVAALLAGLLVVVVMLAIAAVQPRHGLELEIAGEGAGQRVVARGVVGYALPVVVAGVADRGTVLPLLPADLTPEPDVLADYATLDSFLARQDRFSDALDREHALVVIEGGTARRIAATSDRGIPFGCWQQLLTGLIGFAISAWIWSIAPRRLANCLFGLSGVAMLAFTASAGVYTTREIAMDGAVFAVLSNVNMIGASMFGIAMTCLFLVYPRRIASDQVLIGIAAFFATWALLAIVRVLPSPAIGGHLAVTVEMAMIAGGIVAQIFATRGDPVGRAALRWIGTATLLGAGLFIASTSGPAAFGLPPLIDQGWAFAFFLIIHAGVAIGLRRERLFAIDTWGLGLLFYGGMTAVFVATDLILVTVLGSIQAAAALTGVILLPLLYLPLRDILTRRLRGRVDIAATLERVAVVALAPTPAEREKLWRQALDGAFAPLEIVPERTTDRAQIVDEGRAMIVPGIGDAAANRLTLARRGRALFQPADLQLARRMVDLASQVDVDRRAYERGVDTERMRVARDLHDDLAARLLSGLALDDPERMRETLRASLAEVRGIVNATLAGPAPLVDVLADSRSEAAERLEARRIALDWVPDAMAGTLDAEMAKALTSAMRELTTNVLKHSQAATMRVFARLDLGWLHIRVEDDGAASRHGPVVPGNGLKNIVQRMKMVGGHADHEFGEGGFRMTLALPVAMS